MSHTLRSILLPFAAMTASLLAAAVTVDAAIIRMHSEATVTTPLVRLSDIAEVSEGTPERVLQLSELTISPAPIAGGTARITLDTVRRELSLRGVQQSDLQFTGTTATLVHRVSEETVHVQPSKKVTPQTVKAIESAISKYLQNQTKKGRYIGVTLRESSMDSIPAGFSERVPFEIRESRPVDQETITFTLAFETEQGRPSLFTVTARIKVEQDVLALKYSLPRGQVIRESDLMWIEPSKNQPGMTDLEDVVGMEISRNVRAMVPLQHSDIRKVPLIRRGDVVAVTARIGQISVMRYCRSNDEGALGQFITVTPVEGKGKITAQVTGYRAAEIGTSTRNETEDLIQQQDPIAQSQNGLQLFQSDSTPKKPAPPQRVRPVASPYSRPQVQSKVLANQPARLTP